MAKLETILSILGDRSTGDDVRTQNAAAVQSIAAMLRTSLGPMGLDKIIISEGGEYLITNDGATIIGQLKVEHPAGRLLQELSEMQDRLVGDGTTTVVLLAAAALCQANTHIRRGIHPTPMIIGLQRAAHIADTYLTSRLATPVADLGMPALLSVAATTLSSKLASSEKAFFAQLVIDALITVPKAAAGTAAAGTAGSAAASDAATPDAAAPAKGPALPAAGSPCGIAGAVASTTVQLLKAPGRSARESLAIDGFALNCTRADVAMPESLTGGVRIAIVDFSLQRYRLDMGVQVQLDSPDDLDAIRAREVAIARRRCRLLIDAGAQLVLCTSIIDSACAKYFVDAGVIAVRHVSATDARRIAAASGATVLGTLTDDEGSEAVDSAVLGHADSVTELRIGHHTLLAIRGLPTERVRSIVLRGPNAAVLDELERSLHDAICSVRRTIESHMVVPGGGAVEAALSVHLEHTALGLSDTDQIAAAALAEAMLTIPSALALNAAHDVPRAIAALRAHHSTTCDADARPPPRQDPRFVGLDLATGEPANMFVLGVLEPLSSKTRALSMAIEAAVSLLRVDDLIRVPDRQAQDERPGMH